MKKKQTKKNKNQTKMKKKQTNILLLIGLVIIIAFVLVGLNTEKENNVERIVKKTNVQPGEIISVKLDVSVKNSETFYAVEEHIPFGWEIVDAGEGTTNNPNVLKWVVIENIEDIYYTYKIKAPSDSGDYMPSGIYMFGDSSQPMTISGDSIIKVSS